MSIPTAQLYPDLHRELVALLQSLTPEDWQKPTVCGQWRVRDIAAHILDTQLRLLSLGRDRHQPPAPTVPIAGYGDLVAFLNQLNHDWVHMMQRLSPKVLVELLKVSGPALSDYVLSLDPSGPALFPVSWAGEETSSNWMDIGRNYTEYWHHQQQIRDAVGAPPLYDRKFLNPVLALFVHSLRRSYAGKPEAIVTVEITGEAGGVWTYSAAEGIQPGGSAQSNACVVMDADTAWRFFTKGLTAEQARARIHTTGNPRWTELFFSSLAIMG